MLSGDNGILQKATDAKTQTGIGQEKEIIALAYNSALAKKVGNGESTSVTAEDLNVELTNQGANADGENPIEVTFSVSQNVYAINSNGNIEKALPPEAMVAGAKVRDSKSNKIATSNTELVDDYGNKITIPKGFKIVDGTNVADGIVIEDYNVETKATKGNQFVWVPVGSSIKKSETETVEIKLGRYTFNSSNGTPALVQEASKTNYTTGIAVDSNFYEYNDTNTTYGNTKSKALGSFISSAIDNGGYYIGRYEAGINSSKDQWTLANYTWNNDNYIYVATDSTKVFARDGSIKPIIKSGVGIWNGVTQQEAATISQKMYSNINSDLINSYTWDTTIVFIEKCGLGSSNYANQTDGGGEVKQTGSNGDQQCNINDMAGNVAEWSTETDAFSYTSIPCVYRGNNCSVPNTFVSDRRGNPISYYSSLTGFRTILYL